MPRRKALLTSLLGTLAVAATPAYACLPVGHTVRLSSVDYSRLASAFAAQAASIDIVRLDKATPVFDHALRVKQLAQYASYGPKLADYTNTLKGELNAAVATRYELTVIQRIKGNSPKTINILGDANRGVRRDSTGSDILLWYDDAGAPATGAENMLAEHEWSPSLYLSAPPCWTSVKFAKDEDYLLIRDKHGRLLSGQGLSPFLGNLKLGQGDRSLWLRAIQSAVAKGSEKH